MSLNKITSEREKYIGGSDIPIIMGLGNKYNKSFIDLAKFKAGLTTQENDKNEYTQYGNFMEPLILEHANKKFKGTKDEYFKKCFIIEKYTNSDIGTRINLDGYAKNNINEYILEIKTFSGVPDLEYYNAQIQFYMYCLNLSSCLAYLYERPENFFNGTTYEDIDNPEKYDLNFCVNNLKIIEFKKDIDYCQKIIERIELFKKLVYKLKNDILTNDE